MAMLKTISITVSGNVQGVFYRQTTKEKAISLGVKGKVMNLENGNVLIIATATDEKVDQLIEWCKIGPKKAVVTSVNVKELSLQLFDQFTIERV